ncbi:hypothetical protein DBN76_06750 [Enterococcus faecalis]|nr:hypothetical protein [Enterococcus faecalis]
MSGHKTIERTHVRKSMSQRGEILMHLKELDAKRLVLSFVLPCFSKAFLSSGGGGWSEIEINTKQVIRYEKWKDDFSVNSHKIN